MTFGSSKQTPQEVLDLFRAYRSNAWQLFYKARLFVAAPSIFAGLRVGVTLAVVGAVVADRLDYTLQRMEEMGTLAEGAQVAMDELVDRGPIEQAVQDLGEADPRCGS